MSYTDTVIADPEKTLDENAKHAARVLTENHRRLGFIPSGFYAYYSNDGRPLFWIIRLDHPKSREKVIRPLSLRGDEFRLALPDFPVTGSPLYRFEALAMNPSEPVWVVEGEKCVEALAALGVLAVTSRGGSQSGGKSDWRPLTGRGVIIWPDFDESGQDYADTVTDALSGLARSVEWIDAAALDLPDHGDVVDWLAAHPGATAEDLAALPRILPPIQADADSGGNGGGAGDEVEPVRSVCIADIEARPVEWLWKGRIARGAFTLLAGKPGEGKSQLTCNLAAIVTTGGFWPDGTRSDTGSVFMVSAEDSVSQTVRPRLEAAGADLTRCHFAQEPGFHIVADLPRLAARLAELPDTRLVIIDPLAAYLGGVDSHNNGETRAALAPLADFAERCGAAIICVAHFNKGGGTDALMKVGGSVAFTAAARAVYQVTRDPEDPERRLFVASKNNLGADTGGYSFTLERVNLGEKVETSRVRWGDAVDMTADESLAAAQGGSDRSALEEAECFLNDLLGDSEVGAEEVKRKAGGEGIARRTLRRAKDRLGVRVRKMGGGGPWVWSLPSDTPEDNEAAQVVQGGQDDPETKLGRLGHLAPSLSAADDAQAGRMGGAKVRDGPEPHSVAVEEDMAAIDRRIYGPGAWFPASPSTGRKSNDIRKTKRS